MALDMVDLSSKTNTPGTSLTISHFDSAKIGAKEFAQNAGSAIATGAKAVGNYVVNPENQNGYTESIQDSVNKAIKTVKEGAKELANSLEGKPVAYLSTPLPLPKGIKNAFVPEDEKENLITGKKDNGAVVRNKLRNFHQAVITNSSKAGIFAGEKTYSVIRGVLLATGLGYFNAFRALVNAIALIGDFFIRGAVEFTGNLAHLATPIAATALAVVGLATSPFWIGSAVLYRELSPQINNLEMILHKNDKRAHKEKYVNVVADLNAKNAAKENFEKVDAELVELPVAENTTRTSTPSLQTFEFDLPADKGFLANLPYVGRMFA